MSSTNRSHGRTVDIVMCSPLGFGTQEDIVTQAVTSPMQSNFGRRNRNSEFSSDDLVGEVVNVAQYNNRPQLRWKRR